MPLDGNTVSADLQDNPALLLHSRQELPRQGLSLNLAAITAFDGVVGSVLSQGMEFVISANMTLIREPQMGQRHVTLRKDFRYGPDDYTLWPQLYLSQFPHHGCIPAQPVDGFNHDLAVLWWDPSPADLVQLGGNLLRGRVQLGPEAMSRLQKVADQIAARASSVQTRNTHLSRLLNGLRQMLFRLRRLPMNEEMTRFSITEYQRYALEAIGALDYLQVYLPRINGDTPPATDTAETIGVFVTNDRLAQEFLQAGIPYWWIRPLSDLPAARIDSVVDLRSPSGTICTEPISLPSVAIFSGSADDPKKYDAIYSFSRSWFCVSDPYQHHLQYLIQGLRSPASASAALADPPSEGNSGRKRRRGLPCK